MMREAIGVRWNDALSFEPIGKRSRGSFRSALRRYGFDRREIAAVLPAVDRDELATLYRHGHRIELQPL